MDMFTFLFLACSVHYCRTADVLNETRKLVNEHGTREDRFGWAVDVDDHHLVVGAPDDGHGSVTVYRKNSDDTIQVPGKKITSPDRKHGGGIGFGRSVAVNDKFIAIAGRRGAVYVYTTDDHYSFKTKLQANVGFGNSVDINNDNTIVVGANDEGAVYIFSYSDSKWTLTQKLKPFGSHVNDWFGYAVSITTTVLAVGAPGPIWGDKPYTGAKAVYIYTKRNNMWTQSHKLTPIHTGRAFFGMSVMTQNGRLVVGAPGDLGEGKVPSKVFIYEHNSVNDTWDTEGVLDKDFGRSFGYNVAVDDNIVVVTHIKNSEAHSDGLALVFEKDTFHDTWVKKATLRTSDIPREDYAVGTCVRVYRKFIYVGMDFLHSHTFWRDFVYVYKYQQPV